jgi:hypothetical protein
MQLLFVFVASIMAIPKSDDISCNYSEGETNNPSCGPYETCIADMGELTAGKYFCRLRPLNDG